MTDGPQQPGDNGNGEAHRAKGIALGAGAGIIFGAALGNAGLGLVIGAAIGLVAGPALLQKFD